MGMTMTQKILAAAAGLSDDSDQVNTVSKESVDAVLDAISGYGM